MFKIGTLADWFGVGLLEGIRASGRCGATGVQVYAWEELNPLTTTPAQVAEVKAVAQKAGQDITALCGELGGHGLEIRADNGQKLDYLKRTVEMALALDCRIVTTHIGRIPEDQGSERYQIMQEACAEIGRFAAERGVFIAVETGPEPVARLKTFIEDCGAVTTAGGMAINYDPANLVMVTQDDEVAGVHTAGGLIVHTHAKDGKFIYYMGPEKVYGLFAEGGIELLREQPAFLETPLGQGQVRWPAYLRALRDIGYTGYLTIEREITGDAATDIQTAVGFLQEMLATL